MKTYWLSFCDEHTGERLGVCVVEVSEEQAREAVEVVKGIKGFCPEGEEWPVAAIGQSLAMECNPGGDVQATEVDLTRLPPDVPRNRLLQSDELRRNGWA